LCLCVCVCMCVRAEMNRTDNKMGNVAASSGGDVTDLRGFSAARRQLLDQGIAKISDSVTGQTVVDPKGYLTDIDSLKVTSEAEIGDIKKARALLKSVISTNPKHAPGWLAAARLEEQVRMTCLDAAYACMPAACLLPSIAD
jgi:pre-mRNA-processing factor 6